MEAPEPDPAEPDLRIVEASVQRITLLDAFTICLDLLTFASPIIYGVALPLYDAFLKNFMSGLNEKRKIDVLAPHIERHLSYEPEPGRTLAQELHQARELRNRLTHRATFVDPESDKVVALDMKARSLEPPTIAPLEVDDLEATVDRLIRISEALGAYLKNALSEAQLKHLSAVAIHTTLDPDSEG